MEYKSRISYLRDQISKTEIDTLFISNKDNIRYYSGFTGTFAFLLISESKAIIITDSRYTLRAEEESADLRNELKIEIGKLKTKTRKVPGLAVIQVGNVSASNVYVKAKTKSAKEVGIQVIDHHLPENISQKELLEVVNKLNKQRYGLDDAKNGLKET